LKKRARAEKQENKETNCKINNFAVSCFFLFLSLSFSSHLLQPLTPNKINKRKMLFLFCVLILFGGAVGLGRWKRKSFVIAGKSSLFFGFNMFFGEDFLTSDKRFLIPFLSLSFLFIPFSLFLLFIFSFPSPFFLGMKI